MNNRTNFLQNNGYVLSVPKFPDLGFYTTSFVLPGMLLPTVPTNNPFSTLPIPGDRVSYEPMVFTFIIDENLENFQALSEWIKSIAYATEYPDYTDYAKKDEYATLGEQDISVSILSSANNPVKVFTFVNAVPVSLQGETFTSQDANTNYLYGQVTFEYEYYLISEPQ